MLKDYTPLVGAELKIEVKKLADPKRAEASKRFFKTGKGEYGEGDQFIGLSVPKCRAIAKQFKDLLLLEIKELLESKIHEERLIALFILVGRFAKADEKLKKEIFDFYLENTKLINNWDLVDSSAYFIVGEYLLDKPRDILYKLAKSENLWERRIAIIATLQFIKKKKEFKDTFKIAEVLLNDNHDLIHKAVGWMLREVGEKVGQKELVIFLAKHYRQALNGHYVPIYKIMPRTMLRYSIEKFEEDLRKKYLDGLI